MSRRQDLQLDDEGRVIPHNTANVLAGNCLVLGIGEAVHSTECPFSCDITHCELDWLWRVTSYEIEVM